jgi:hypothetical protein
VSDLPTLPPLDPERVEVIKRQVAAVAAALFDALTDSQALDQSMAGRSPGARMMARVLRSQLPTMRREILSRLSEVDGRGLEAMIGAVATALEATLYYAPGTALPRFRFEWSTAADGRPHVELVPDETVPSVVAG